MSASVRISPLCLAGVVVAFLVSACASGSSSPTSASSPAQSSASPVPTGVTSLPINPPLSHVHGAVVAGSDLLIGTHHGVFRVSTTTGASQLVGAAEADFMGLSGDGSGRLFASGHPGPGLGAVDPLGLIVSGDQGETWETRSLEGEVDFHALASRGDEIVGWGTPGILRASTDAGLTWTDGPEVSITSLAWFGDEVWIATTRLGLQSWRPGDPDTTSLGIDGILVATSPDADVVWRMDMDGSVHRSGDGSTWTTVGSVASVEAFAADDTHAYIVTAGELVVITTP